MINAKAKDHDFVETHLNYFWCLLLIATSVYCFQKISCCEVIGQASRIASVRPDKSEAGCRFTIETELNLELQFESQAL